MVIVILSLWLLCFGSIWKSSLCFVWSVDENLYLEEPVIVSEGYMFASNKGPFLMSRGDSFIDVEVQFNAKSYKNDTSHVLLVYVATDEEHGRSADLLPSLCSLTSSPHALEKESYVYDATVKNIVLYFAGCDSAATSDVTICHRQRSFTERFPVIHTAWHSIFFVQCEGYDGRASHSGSGIGSVSVMVSGNVAFKNPYGFIAAELSGLLPSQIIRLLLSFAALIVFAVMARRHRHTLLPLHYAVLTLLVLATTEAVVWTISFFWTQNKQGRPYCCPFPVSVAVALVLQVLRQALCRTVLLVSCLGYAIVRPRLLLLEWILTGLLSALYLVASLTAQALSLKSFTSLSTAAAATDTNMFIQGIASFLDLIFLFWICTALQATMRVLAEYRQTEKLALYASLWRVLTVSVLVFVIVSILFALDDYDIMSLGPIVHWRLTWLQPALWDLLNSLVLVAVAWLCLPSARAVLLAYHAQLSQVDDDDDFLMDEDGVMLLERGTQNIGGSYSNRNKGTNSLFDYDEEDEDEEDVHRGFNFFMRNHRGSSLNNTDNKYSISNNQVRSKLGDDQDVSSHGASGTASLDDYDDMEKVLQKQRGGFVSKNVLTKDAFSATLSDDDLDDHHWQNNTELKNNKTRAINNFSAASTNYKDMEEDNEFGLDD